MFLATPSPPDTITAPVIDDNDSVVFVTLNIPLALAVVKLAGAAVLAPITKLSA